MSSIALLLASTCAFGGRLERVLDLQGALSPSDMKLPAGESADVFPVALAAGDRVLVEMSSKKLDTYVVLQGPDGTALSIDDTDGELGFSQIDLIVEATGTWLVYATSKLPGEKGKYALVVSVDRSGEVPPESPASSSSISAGESVQGSLGAGDPTLTAGEWYDQYDLDLQAGETLVADLSSDAFDTYVAVRTPSGATFGNDDHEGSRNRSRVEQVVEETGTYAIFATAYAAEQGGAYSLSISSQGATTEEGVDRWSGTLADGDGVLVNGEYNDVIRLQGEAGERWILDLRSSDFDPYLILRYADGEQSYNDDFEGARDRSLLDVTLPASGEQAIGVTTYAAGQAGRYDLTLRRVTGGTTGVQRHTGTLAEGDGLLDGGEWFDAYTFEGVPGQTLAVNLRGDFDTYLGVLGPTSFRQENDDGDGTGHSFVSAVLDEAGTYRVVATSYQAGQGGDYTLDIALDQASEAASDQRDVVVLGSGTEASGALAEGDLTLDSGEYQDLYALDVEEGQLISVSLASSDFDPFVGVLLMDGSAVENDDWEGSSALARVDVEAPETGRYRVVATSYRPGSVGAYTLQATVSAGSGELAAAPETTGRIFGIFLGISDYPDDGPGDLDFTADDAQALYDGMVGVGMRPEHGRVLVDSAATSDALAAAIQEFGGQMGADDRMMLFYSGHGGRVAVEGGAQAADPDGFDETVALYDRQVTDDELARLLGGVSQGTVLLVLDSCFSGGFSKDVISLPHRMGLFSSHEDVTSQVAAKFRAGGYLARFMVEAVGMRLADDGDGAITALELSQYLYERYRSDVKSMMPGEKSGAYDDIVMTGQNLGYQQIIVDRGGVGPSAVLFAW